MSPNFLHPHQLPNLQLVYAEEDGRLDVKLDPDWEADAHGQAQVKGFLEPYLLQPITASSKAHVEHGLRTLLGDLISQGKLVRKPAR